jgi:MoaA/NifB/PqqE/SkfB family radical SAM enzyme
MKYAECRLPWKNANILSNGEVKPCCWCRGDFGNLNERSFEEIWNSEKASELRCSIINNEIHPMCINAPCPYNTSKGKP